MKLTGVAMRLIDRHIARQEVRVCSCDDGVEVVPLADEVEDVLDEYSSPADAGLAVGERPPDWPDHHGADACEAGGLAADG
jgi:hypothetical protein